MCEELTMKSFLLIHEIYIHGNNSIMFFNLAVQSQQSDQKLF